MLLADSAQAELSGKVYMLGVGWTRTGVPTGPMAVVVLLHMREIQEASSPHEVELELVDGSGTPVSFLPHLGGSMKLTAKVEPNVDAGVDVPIVAPIVLQLSGLPLAADQTYTWRVEVDGRRDDDWTASVHHPPTAVATCAVGASSPGDAIGSPSKGLPGFG